MAGLRPRVRVQQVEELQGAVGYSRQYLEGVSVMQPDIGERWVRALISRNMHERLSDAVKKRFATDKAVIGEQVRTRGQMLATAEPDFEMQRAIVAKQALGRHRALAWHRNLRQ